ncbi:hypothetical protein Btru_004209, partial [Bulinus truncatus]
DCSVTYASGEPVFKCQKKDACLHDTSHFTGQCEGDGVEIHPGVCKLCCDKADCLTNVINVLKIESNHNLFCPGQCNERDLASCIQSGTHCSQGQFCEVGIDDHLIVRGTCKFYHDLQKCNDDKSKHPCANSLLSGGHVTKCVWDCCSTPDCLNTHFGSYIVNGVTIMQQPVTVVPIVDPPVRCMTCSGNDCLTSLQIMNCPDGFCMHSVHHLDSGTVFHEKSCASRDMCRIQWVMQSDVVKTRCTDALQHINISPLPLTCHYCCHDDMCNVAEIALLKLFNS